MRTVVGAAIIRDGELLAAQRAEPESMRGLWEFPGGKKRDHESEQEALIREIREELGAEIEVGERFGSVEILGGAYELVIYLATLKADSPQPTNLEHQALRWVTERDISHIPWIPADLPLVEGLVRANHLQ